MNALSERIARLIQAQGPITVAQYMTMALHDPQHGYYATRDPFGVRGDFITSPEISQMFGELLGLWIAQCWLDQGSPAKAILMELGPGRGTLMADALRATRNVPGFHAALEVMLVEASPVLRAIQQEVLKDCGVKVRWESVFDPDRIDRPLFLLTNEFFDALPIRQFVKTGRGWHERMVTLDTDGALAFALTPEPLPIRVPDRGPAEPGAVFELCTQANTVAETIADRIVHEGGAALIVDYGYGAEAGYGETLQALRGQAFAPLLDAPGEADLSAHVDFASLAYAAQEEGGGTVFGPVPQGELLDRLGIAIRAAKLGQEDARERLTSPAQMGTLFKALAILPYGARKPEGF